MIVDSWDEASKKLRGSTQVSSFAKAMENAFKLFQSQKGVHQKAYTKGFQSMAFIPYE